MHPFLRLGTASLIAFRLGGASSGGACHLAGTPVAHWHPHVAEAGTHARRRRGDIALAVRYG